MLSAKDSKLIGLYFGVMMGEADDDSDPLHTLKPSLETDGCVIDSLAMGVFALGGEIELADTQINAVMCGVMSNVETGTMAQEQYQGDIILENVEINLTAKHIEDGIDWHLFLQSLGGAYSGSYFSRGKEPQEATTSFSGIMVSYLLDSVIGASYSKATFTASDGYASSYGPGAVDAWYINEKDPSASLPMIFSAAFTPATRPWAAASS